MAMHDSDVGLLLILFTNLKLLQFGIHYAVEPHGFFFCNLINRP